MINLQDIRNRINSGFRDVQNPAGQFLEQLAPQTRQHPRTDDAAANATQPDLPITTPQDFLKAERLYARQLRLPNGYVAAAAQPTYGFMAWPVVQTGRIQEVLFISVSGSDPFTALAGQAMGFISTYVPQDSAVEPPFPNLVVAPANIPLVNAPTRRQVLLWPGERFIICFKGLANGAQVAASIAVIEYELSSFIKALAP